MPLPDDVPTFTLVAEFPPLSPGGAERTGALTFTPIPSVLPSPDAVYLGVENATLNASGGMSKTLIANDAFDEDFVWRIDGNIDGCTPFSLNISVPASAGTVNLGAVAEFEVLLPHYVVILGPQGPEGPAGSGGGTGAPSSTVAAQTAFGAASTAGSATTYSRGDHAHGTPATPTKSTVGLANVDNTSDAGKPVSTAVQNALNAEVTRANGAYDATGAASAVAGNLTAHTGASTSVHGIANTAALVLTGDSRLTDNRTPTGTAGGDLSGTFPNPTVAKVAGATVSGTPSSGKVLTATSGSAASWQTPAGGGGSSTVRTASVRVTDDDLSGVPSAASWAVVHTSAGTPLQCSIAAADGDRIRVCGQFMRSGSRFLDWVLLDSAGAIAVYATSESGTVPSEGNPSLYPSLSFSYATADDMFAVASEHVDGSGNVTIALANQGTAAGIVYAHAVYPWRLRLENIGPEPA